MGEKFSDIYSKFTYRWAIIFFIPSLIAIFKPFLQGVLKKFHQTFTFTVIYPSTFIRQKKLQGNAIFYNLLSLLKVKNRAVNAIFGAKISHIFFG